MGFVDRLSGKTAAKAAKKAGDIQSEAATLAAGNAFEVGQQASGLYDPFQQIAQQQGVEQAGFLTDPNAQFDFLQNNPLFQMGLDNANEQTLKSAASRGRLSAGDTLEQLTANSLLQAAPLISDQKNSISNMLTMGQNVAGNQGTILQNATTNQGNLLTGGAAAQAGGIVGAENARGAGYQNMIDIGGKVAAAFSDPALKTNIDKLGTYNGYNIYKWDWNDEAKHLGLTGSSSGVMADEVKKINPDAVSMNNGYMMVDYKAIGAKH
jgi:hypothetical protein